MNVWGMRSGPVCRPIDAMLTAACASPGDFLSILSEIERNYLWV